jgi:hypothetical protein
MSIYRYSGREEAPEPVKNEAPAPVVEPVVEPKVEPEFKWDFAAFRASLKEGISG